MAQEASALRNNLPELKGRPYLNFIKSLKCEQTKGAYMRQGRKEQATKPEAKADRDFIIKRLAVKPHVPITLLCKEREH